MEILGLNQEVVDKYFTGAVSRIQGIGLEELAKKHW
jgi:glutamate synthase (NADPH/NADH) large chain